MCQNFLLRKGTCRDGAVFENAQGRRIELALGVDLVQRALVAPLIAYPPRAGFGAGHAR